MEGGKKEERNRQDKVGRIKTYCKESGEEKEERTEVGETGVRDRKGIFGGMKVVCREKGAENVS